MKIDSYKLKKYFETQNVALYIFAIIVLAITWSGMKTIQTNYQLQKQISTLQQQNSVLQLQNQNAALKNQYYQTNAYLDLAARQDLGLAAPGETVMLISKNVALKYVDQSLAPPSSASNDNRPQYIKNLDDWRNFLLGRKSQSD